MTIKRSSRPCRMSEIAARLCYHQGLCCFWNRELFLQQRRSDERAHRADAGVINAGGVVGGCEGVGSAGHTMNFRQPLAQSFQALEANLP